MTPRTIFIDFKLQLDHHHHNKTQFAQFREAMYHFEPQSVRNTLGKLISPEATIHLAHPLGTVSGPGEFYDTAYAPLHHSLPDLERRDFIVMAGPGLDNGHHWIGCCGYYQGSFTQPWLDIPPTGGFSAMRYHEFFHFVEDEIVEVQALWDIPELMMQARAWPMSPSLGFESITPGPATNDGLVNGPRDDELSERSRELVLAMLNGLGRYAEGGVQAMELERYWHPGFNWYGPAGIGTSRGISGFRRCHQIPFLNAMPDRRALLGRNSHFFADGDYVAFTAWPGMEMTISGDGWLGIAPANQFITLRSLDFWRCENGKIRENWVLVDLLDMYHQLGVDVLARMIELNPPTRATE